MVNNVMNVMLIMFYIMMNVLMSAQMDFTKEIKNVLNVLKVAQYVLMLIPALLVKKEKN